MHKVAQYLATAAISFIQKKEDDSHTNLGWANHTLETHQFSNGDKLGLNYENFSLEWTHYNGNKQHLLLDKTTHKEIKDWISETSTNNGIETPYKYNLHYELPYDEVTDATSFKLTNQEDINVLIEQRDLAQQVFDSILKSNAFDSTIRIWPHHFDTGAFVIINSQLSIGLGMAIPDELINDFYFYISGYNGHESINIESVKDLKHGAYYSNGWKGFALPVDGIDKDIAISFCQEAISKYADVSI